MPSRTLALVFGCAIASGCGSSSANGTDPATCTGPSCTTPQGDGCPEGLARDAATGACLDVSPVEDCGPGTGAFLGSTTCKPVGWTSCAAPFEADPSGWGCQPIAPRAACPAGTMATLGASACAPVGDCSAPFPPANATMFVDATFASTDATHYTSLFDAAQSANAGAVIAVAPGTYVEDVDVSRSNVTIVGKCAAQVIIKNPGDRRAGILVTDGARNVTVRGLTLTGHYSGILVKAGSEGRLEDSLIVKNRYLGAYVAEANSKLTVVRTLIDDVVVDDVGKFGWGAAAQLGGNLSLEDVVISAPTGTGIVIGGAKSTGKLSRVVVRAPRPSNDGFGSALGVVDGGTVDLDGALFEDLKAIGVTVSGGTATARHLVVRRTVPSSTPETGRGIQVSLGGHLELAESRISESDDANVLVIGAGSSAKIASSVIAGELGGDGSRGHHGVRVAGGASLELSTSALVGNVEVGLSVQDPTTHATADGILVTDSRPSSNAAKNNFLGIGVGVAWGGTLQLSHASIAKNHAAGILVSKVDESGAAAHADIKSTLVRRTMPDAVGFAGRGIEVSAGASASVEGCALVENNETSLSVGRPGSALSVRSTLVRDTRQAGGAGSFGHGLVASESGVAALDGVWMLGHPGIAVIVSGGSATVTHSLIARSAIALGVAEGTDLTTAEQIPDPPSPLACVVSNDTRFVDNQTRVGSGAIPLPSPLGEPPRAPKKP